MRKHILLILLCIIFLGAQEFNIIEPKVKVLVNQFYSSNQKIRNAALAKILGIGSSASPSLIAALKINNKNVYSYCVTALLQVGKKSDLELALKSPHPRVQSGAKYVLNEKAKQQKIHSEISQQISPQVNQFIEKFYSPDKKVRDKALMQLVKMKEKAVPSLIAALQIPNQQVYLYVVYSLINIGQSATPSLRQALNHSNVTIRNGAKFALSKIPQPRNVPRKKVKVAANKQTLKTQKQKTTQSADKKEESLESNLKIQSLSKNLQPIAKRLLSSNYSDRVYGARDAQRMGKAGLPLLPFLVQALDHPKPYVTKKVTSALLTFGADAIPALTTGLQNSHSQVRWYSCQLLGILVAVQSKSKVENLLSDSNAQVQKVAQETLNIFQKEQMYSDSSPQNIRKLIENLDSVDYKTRTKSRQALINMKEKAFGSLLAAVADQNNSLRRSATKLINEIEISPASISEIMSVVHHPNQNLQKIAHTILYRKMGDGAIAPLVNYANSSDISKRTQAVFCLSILGPKHRYAGELAKSKSKWQQLRSQTILPAIMKSLTHHNSQLQQSAINAVVTLVQKNEYLLEIIVSHLRNDSSQAQAGCALVIGKMKAFKLKKELLEKTAHDDETVRDACCWALANMYANETPSSKAVSSVTRLLQDEDNNIKTWATNKMQEYGPLATSVSSLIPLLKSDDQHVRRTTTYTLAQMGTKATEAIPHLMTLLNHDKEDTVRAGAAKAIFHIKITDTKYLQDLIASLNDSYQDVRRHVAKSIAGMGTEAIQPLIIAAATDEENTRFYCGKAAGHIGQDAIADMINLLTHNDWRLREMAAIAFGVMGEIAEPAVPTLVQSMQRETNYSTRFEMALALGEIGKNTSDIENTLVAEAKKKQGARGACLQALAKIGCQNYQTVSLYLNALADTQWKSRIWAIKGLGKAKAKRGVTPLVIIANDYKESYQMRQAAKKALLLITGQ
ncbi:HEAT repeat domain-containing protein [Candidatus Uabimicrobium sp. HlEnr_7]|uniref:HEAT repeat domain-containing protein n=1 Tax=Candidatus Uabimicrobium helgolandensis TaxID=3095367 RepID=UPI003557C708